MLESNRLGSEQVGCESKINCLSVYPIYANYVPVICKHHPTPTHLLGTMGDCWAEVWGNMFLLCLSVWADALSKKIKTEETV